MLEPSGVGALGWRAGVGALGWSRHWARRGWRAGPEGVVHR